MKLTQKQSDLLYEVAFGRVRDDATAPKRTLTSLERRDLVQRYVGRPGSTQGSQEVELTDAGVREFDRRWA